MKEKKIKKYEDCFLADYSKPQKGSVALCSMGCLGVITEDKPIEVEYPDGNKGKAYVGIHINMKYLGKKWSSRNPIIIGHISELENAVDFSIYQGKKKIMIEKKQKLEKKIKRRKDGKQDD